MKDCEPITKSATFVYHVVQSACWIRLKEKVIRLLSRNGVNGMASLLTITSEISKRKLTKKMFSFESTKSGTLFWSKFFKSRLHILGCLVTVAYHSKYKVMTASFYLQLTGSFVTSNSLHWVQTSPVVLLDLQSTLKAKAEASSVLSPYSLLGWSNRFCLYSFLHTVLFGDIKSPDWWTLLLTN